MFDIGEYVVSRRDVCKITEIKKQAYNDMDYYVLVPVSDPSMKMQVPTESNVIRELLTKEEVEEIIEGIPGIPLLEAMYGNDKLIGVEYKNALQSGTHEDLVRIIKTTYLRNKERLDNNKKIGDKDDSFLKLAEQYLYNEFAIVLDMSYEEAKDYVIKRVEELNK